jgi:hypothetical protein
MAKGRFKHKPTGERSFSSPEDIGTRTLRYAGGALAALFT